jgi:hypothetical protein
LAQDGQERGHEIIKKYGRPTKRTPSRLIWYDNGPWKRTVVYRHEIPHNFPQPHTDVVEQFIDYHVPPEKFSELAKFDGSLIVERTAGEVSARCDMEAATSCHKHDARDRHREADGRRST